MTYMNKICICENDQFDILKIAYHGLTKHEIELSIDPSITEIGAETLSFGLLEIFYFSVFNTIEENKGNGGNKEIIATEKLLWKILENGIAESRGEAFARAVMKTMISGAAAGPVVLIITYVKPLIKGETAYWFVLSTVNGGLADMVAACAECSNMHRGSAFFIGCVAGANYSFYS